MIRRLLAGLLVAAALATGLVVATPQPAQATLSAYRWQYRTVCVEDRTSSSVWPGYSATVRWDAVPDLRFVHRRAGGCEGYRQVITLRSAWKGYDGYYGWTYRWVWTGSTYLSRVTIVMNDTYRYRLGWADRRSAIMHEFGHASGLAHTSRWESLMNTASWWRWDYPTWYDRREVERRYPW
jgi:hypothetical protein